jgi:arylsulfatase A-like enzyme/Tfp pilus assembly protein PilF
MTRPKKKTSSLKNPFRKTILIGLLAALTLALVFYFFSNRRRASEVQVNPLSNILIITLDTTRADRLGCSGYAAAGTPNLDRLARSGVRCQAAYSPVPLTLPAHCSIFSGSYPPAHQVRNNGSYFLPAAVSTLAEMLRDRGFRTSAFVSSFILDSRFGLDQGFDVYDDDFGAGTGKTYQSERPAKEVFNAFSRWLSGRADHKFFSWIHFFDPHAPYDPPEPFRSAFADNPYDGEIACVDHYIGAIITLLEEKKLLQNTLLVIAGDHGEAFGEHGEFGHQVFCYQENLLVPLIFNAPGRLPEHRLIRQKVSLTDIMPTILDFLQIPRPAVSGGQSLLPAMNNAILPDRDIFVESLFAQEAFGCAPLQGIIQKNLKYIDLPKPELYDLRNDPDERENLISRAAASSLKMKKSLKEFNSRFSGNSGQSSRRLTAAEKNTLAALGYITGSVPVAPATARPDPKDKIAGWQKFNQGAEQAANNQFGDAEKNLRQAIAMIPEYAGSYTILANLYYKQGKSEQALALLAEAMTRLGSDATLKTEFAALLIKMNRLDQALVLLRELEKMNLVDKKAFIFSQLGQIYEQRENFPQAISAYRRAHETEPENSDYARRLAYLLHRSNRLAEALEIYQRLEPITPEDIQLTRDMAIIYAQLGEYPLAKKYFEKALQRSPDPNLYFNFALLLARQGDFRQAAAMMEKFLAAAGPESAQAQAGRRYLAAWQNKL